MMFHFMTGTLEDFQWRIGVMVESSLCKDMNHPYVSVSFRIKEVDGRYTYHNAELNLADLMVTVFYSALYFRSINNM